MTYISQKFSFYFLVAACFSTIVDSRAVSQNIRQIDAFAQAKKTLDGYNSGDIVVFDIDDTLIYSPVNDEYIAIEPGIVHIINELKNRGCKVFALTATPSYRDVWQYRSEMLKKIGIELSHDYEIKGACQVLLLDAFPPLRGDKNPAIYKGIIYSDLHGKGPVFHEAIQKIYSAEYLHNMPRKVAFFDDRPENIHSMKEVCEKHGIAADLFHYTGAKS